MKPTSVKLRFWLCLAIAVIVLVVPASAQAENAVPNLGANIVPNPDFEISGCSNTPNGPETIICGWPDSIRMFRDTENPHSGEASMGFFSLVRSTCSPIAPGVHSASFWYRSWWWDNPLFVWLTAEFYASADCSGLPLHSDSIGAFADPSDGLWHEVTGVLVAGVPARSAVFAAVSQTDPCCLQPVWFDDLVVVEGFTPMPALPKEGER